MCNTGARCVSAVGIQTRFDGDESAPWQRPESGSMQKTMADEPPHRGLRTTTRNASN